MKTEPLDFIELFGGICGFLQGFLQAGWTFNNHYYSEIDKHAIAATKYNFKNTIHVGPVEHITGNQLSRNAIFTFGSPCQDFSIAGKRAGMEGERSSLIGEAIRLIDEVRPPIFVWENVKGAYSSNEGRDFQAILREFANLGGYRLEWQLLNTDWVLPQNRERIYLVGHLAGRSFPGVFPFTENDRLFNLAHQPNRRRTQTEISTTLKSSGAMKADDTFIIPKMAGTLTAGGNSGGLHSDMTVIPVLTPDRKEKQQNGRRFKENGDPGFTLSRQDRHGIAIKKNYIQWDESGKGYNSQQDRAFYENGNMGTIPSGRTENKVNVLLNDFQIRRLTEIECERLQGFPDNWTQYGMYLDKEGTEVKKKIPKTQRYKLCGNAVTTNIVELIAIRLKTCLITN